MSQNMLTLLTTAAELRSSGASWQAVGTQVRRSAKTCQKWPSRFPQEWGQLYRSAQQQRFEEAGNEAMVMMRKMLRNSDGKLQLKAGEILIRYGHQLFARKEEGVKLPVGVDMPTAEDIEFARSYRVSQEQDRERLNHQRVKEGLPPVNADEYLELFIQEQLEAIQRDKDQKAERERRHAASGGNVGVGGALALMVLTLVGAAMFAWNQEPLPRPLSEAERRERICSPLHFGEGLEERFVVRQAEPLLALRAQSAFESVVQARVLLRRTTQSTTPSPLQRRF